VIYEDASAIEDAVIALADEDPTTWPVVCRGRCRRDGGCDCEVEPDGECAHSCPSIMVAGGYS
jgi:hypothetical protein